MTRHATALLVMAISGFAGLAYQIVWTQQCALWLGHEAPAVLAVVTAIFAGLALGARLCSSPIERSPRPQYWYAGCELLIAGWNVVLALTMAQTSRWLSAAIGVAPHPLWQLAMTFGATFLLLLPATAAMGATVPAMERLHRGWVDGARTISDLYASNTLGGVLGVLATAFWLIPAYGLTATAMLAVILNLGCIGGAWALAPLAPAAAERLPSTRLPRGLAATLFCTGFLGIGFEVLVVRVLSQVTEDTVYTFALLLAIYLLGTALGAAWYRQRIRQPGLDASGLEGLWLALAVACMLGAWSLWGAEQLKTHALAVLGPGMGPALVVETLLALVAFGPPTFAMGALFSRLGDRAHASGTGYGHALAANTAGAALAPLAFGYVAFPLLGPRVSLLGIALGYLALSGPSSMLRAKLLLGALAVLISMMWLPPLAFIDVPAGGRIVSYREGAMGAVSVVEDGAGILRLRINNRQQEGTSGTLHVDGRQGLLPLLLHPRPRRALFLGLGTGVTAATAAEESDLRVDAVELLPEVIASSHFFTRIFNEGAPNPRLQVIAADARRFLRATTSSYDVIVSDNFHPARSGSGALYTVEHFEAVRTRLSAGGLFCQWLPLHQLDLATLRSIVKSFLVAFPHGMAMLASNSLQTPVIGLVGREDDSRFEAAAVFTRRDTVALPGSPSAFGIEDGYALFGGFVAGPTALSRFAAGAAANTDEHPVVAYQAPQITYAPVTTPAERLITLLSGLAIDADEILAAPVNPELSRRLNAYWRARDLFVRAGQRVRGGGDVREMLDQVQEPLLAVLRLSPDFRPAYDPLLNMALAIASSDISRARAVLESLSTLQPTRSEAPDALRHLPDDGMPPPPR